MFNLIARLRGPRPSRKDPASSVSSARSVAQTPGRPLPSGLAGAMGASLGHDFSNVRIHDDAQAAASAAHYAAAAYTFGSHIVFGANQYLPDREPGRRLLTHELVHVVQAELGAGPGPGISSSSDPGEQEARDIAAGPPVASSSSDLVTNRPAAAIARFESYEHEWLGDTAAGSPAGGFILLDAHRRDLPGHSSPTAGWPAEWVALWSRGTPEQKRAIRDGLTYGEVLALAGDLYAVVDPHGTTDIGQSVERLNHASLREIWDLIPLVYSRTASTADLEIATAGRYLTLAKQNLSHFSNVPAGQRNIDVWRTGHAQAIRLARAGQANAAWMTSAASDHFLTDAFSGGHLREARAKLMSSSTGQLNAKMQHDLDNKYGVAVTNNRGDQWIAYGDSHLDDKADTKNREIALEAEALSKADISEALARREAYPDPPDPVPGGTFAAEKLIPRPVTINNASWGWWARAGEVAHLLPETTEMLTPNDTRIRDWTARQEPAAIREVAVAEKIRMVNRLLDYWVSGDDIDAIERIFVNSSNTDRDQIGRVIASRIGSLFSIGQRTRLRLLIERRE
jgi:Domain of unknown function (DUF4157)